MVDVVVVVVVGVVAVVVVELGLAQNMEVAAQRVVVVHLRMMFPVHYHSSCSIVLVHNVLVVVSNHHVHSGLEFQIELDMHQ